LENKRALHTCGRMPKDFLPERLFAGMSKCL
jgi:hypothetical protein